uniref:Ribosomal RNA-processing protein 8 n=1 Tax=Petromyzon marinus TaxID=7757 RepID=A0AAJ7T7G8_PETMA|nr:ribosomal RNA-processing protein 8 [Petromyzon marinus]
MFAVSQWGDAHEGRSLTKALFPSGQKGARRPPQRSPKTPSPAQLPQASSTAPPPAPPKGGAGGAVEKEKKKRKRRRKLRVRRGAAEEGPAAEGACDGAGEAEGSTRKTPRRRKTPVDEKWRPKGKRTRKRPSQSEAPADGDADKTETRKRKKSKTSASAGDAATAPADELGECANDRPPRKKAKAEIAEGDEQSGDGGESGVGDEKSRKGNKPLTRKQWQNRMKSKRRIRNKYKQRELVWRKEPEEPGDADDRQVEAPADAAMHDPSLSKYKTKKLKRQKEKEEKQPVEAESCDAVGAEAACDGDVETVGKIKKKKKKVAKSEPKRRKAEGPTENGDAQEGAGVAAVAKSKKEKLKSTKRRSTDDAEEDGGPVVEDGAHPPGPADRSAALRLRMQQRLQGARFRFLNQQLYEGSSRDARALFRDDPQAFRDYHQGFTAQVQRWPVNPLSRIISSIKNRPASLVVADFGCGDAQLAASVRNHVHSFDLVALNERVTACDMAKVPLDAASVDVAVFCLSLMGTNIQDFLTEANRVLRSGGVLMIAEVASRFEDARNFLSALSVLGFKLLSKNMEDTHFHLFELQKIAPPKAKGQLPGLALKPCVYKKR